LTVMGETDRIKQLMKFIVDRTVGKLGKCLRLLGFDVDSWVEGTRNEMAKKAIAEERVVLTRSRKIQEKAGGAPVVLIRNNNPRDQVAEVLSQLRLKPGEEYFFSRCLLCNEILLSIPKEKAEGKVPDYIYQAYDSFHVCPRCQRIYWPGTHWQKMKKELGNMV
jgi:uncharacterized protein